MCRTFDPKAIDALQRQYPEWAKPHDPREVVAQARAALEAAVPGIPVEEKHHETYFGLTLPTASESDYTFGADIHRDVPDMGVGAVLPNEPALDLPPLCFWGRVMEAWDYPSPAALVEEFIATLVLVASNPTRVRESKGLLLVSYDLEAQTAKGWQRVP
ncbi:MAG: hypothetical protein PVJ51_07030, partial [Acidobacteriota bacterium]